MNSCDSVDWWEAATGLNGDMTVTSMEDKSAIKPPDKLSGV